tara:strand:- start:16393 stop:17847 length:1455 start_codon:yes stop_codon:yes gene_type:complete
MLGYSQYSQVSCSLIVQQKIRVFLLSKFIFNRGVIGFLKNSSLATGSIQQSVVDIYYALFVDFLKDSGIYEEYLFTSLLVDEPNYDFITNEETATITKAEDALKEVFFKTFKEIVGLKGEQEADSSPTQSSIQLFLSSLVEGGRLRSIPKYENGDVIDVNYDHNAPENADTYVGKKEEKAKKLGARNLYLINSEKEINEMFKQTDIKDVFYLETFYRVKKEATEKLSENEIKRGQFLSITEIVDYVKDNKDRGIEGKDLVLGIRLMLNTTGLIDFSKVNTQVQEQTVLKEMPIAYKEALSAFPQFLPFLNGAGGWFGKESYLSALFRFGLQQPTSTNYLAIKNFDKMNPSMHLSGEQFFLTRSKDAVGDPNSFKFSKSLMAVEKKENLFYVYFPIVLSEFVSDSLNVTTENLLGGLEKTTTLNALFDQSGAAKFIGFAPVFQVILDILSKGQKDFFLLDPNSLVKRQNELLDNMLKDLINFDKE